MPISATNGTSFTVSFSTWPQRCRTSVRGVSPGRTEDATPTYIMKSAASRKPGTIPAMNNLTMETSVNVP